MVQINHEVDTASVSGGDFPLLKDGEYPATIVGADAKISKAGDTYLQIQFDLGQTNIWQNFNLWHSSSSRAVDIAKQELNELGSALSMPRIGDSDEIVGKRLTVKVGTEPAQGDWPAKNKIAGYKQPASGLIKAGAQVSQPVQNSPQVTTQTESNAPASSTPVWNT